ncbi:hypothetical protein W97_09064 [Coniosporium apollinis CBS 100218]|uniref:Uncharacterized protein n=1 Tax=Coniosporium apollinis (strain CBS 100218) TaxID=1168221 RepID=R7Z796_CONA1|nr:uncharacterized protein W97_09064 [Coniosporium apollinis CBS 100218]EON69801.1 hypothetical protein W97_09064 [Coniosporium apollinis CBS 100218]
MANEPYDYTPVDVLNIMEPGQSETIDDLLDRGKTQRVQILIGTENPQRLRQIPARPEQLILWDWGKSFREGMAISFGVNWYDRNFFERRRDAFTEPKHAAYYRRFGAVPEDFDIKHFVEGDPGFDEEVVHHREPPANALIPVSE